MNPNLTYNTIQKKRIVNTNNGYKCGVVENVELFFSCLCSSHSLSSNLGMGREDEEEYFKGSSGYLIRSSVFLVTAFSTLRIIIFKPVSVVLKT